MRYNHFFYLLAILFLVQCNHESSLIMPSILGDHMVLQQSIIASSFCTDQWKRITDCPAVYN